MSSCLRRYSVRHELNTLDACWLAVDVWSNSSRCRKYRSTSLGRDAYMYDHCLRYRHDFARFYQLLDSNLFTHHNTCYGPQGLLHTIFSALHFLLRCTFRLQISLCNQSWRDWKPFKVLVQALLCLRTYSGLVNILLLDWYLCSQTEGNTYCSCAASPFPLQGKNQRKLKRKQCVASSLPLWGKYQRSSRDITYLS